VIARTNSSGDEDQPPVQNVSAIEVEFDANDVENPDPNSPEYKTFMLYQSLIKEIEAAGDLSSL
jgi:hypothetical protein